MKQIETSVLATGRFCRRIAIPEGAIASGAPPACRADSPASGIVIVPFPHGPSHGDPTRSPRRGPVPTGTEAPTARLCIVRGMFSHRAGPLIRRQGDRRRAPAAR